MAKTVERYVVQYYDSFWIDDRFFDNKEKAFEYGDNNYIYSDDWRVVKRSMKYILVLQCAHYADLNWEDVKEYPAEHEEEAFSELELFEKDHPNYDFRIVERIIK